MEDLLDPRWPALAGIALDFLYPAKTMALLKKLTAAARRRRDGRWRQTLDHAPGRPFSTTPAWLSPAYDADLSQLHELPDELDQPESDADQRASHTLEALHSLLRPHLRKEPDKVWDLYSTLEDSERLAGLKLDVMHYLHVSERPLDANRILQVFQTLPPVDCHASSYVWAISACVRLDCVDLAVLLYDEAIAKRLSSRFGSSILFARVLEKEQWDVALHIYQSFMLNSPPDPGVCSESLWELFGEIPALPEKTLSLCNFARGIPETDATKRRGLLTLTRALVKRTARHHMHDTDAAETLWKLFGRLEDLGIGTTQLLRTTFMRLVRSDTSGRYSTKPKLTHLIYRKCRELRDFRLPRATCYLFLRRLCYHESFGREGTGGTEGRTLSVDSFLKDYRRWHDHLGRNTLLLLMRTYARCGNERKVKDYFDQLRKLDPGPLMNVDFLKPLIYVHARRAQVEQAVVQFKSIEDKYELTPDIGCWNILIHAYARVEDVEGAVGVLNELLEKGLEPDKYTLGPIMELYGERGEVDKVVQLLDFARSTNVKVSSSMAGALVLAHINQGDGPSAEATAEGFVQEKADGTLRGPTTLLWNCILTWYAHRVDFKSMVRLHRRMEELEQPLDSLSYAAFMQVLAKLGQTNRAYKILRVIMSDNAVRPTAFHYAIVMAGFITENQIPMALAAHKRMIMRNIRPTISTRFIHLKAQALAAVKSLNRRTSVSRLLQDLENVEKELQQMLIESDPADVAAHQPLKGVAMMTLDQAYPAAYFEFLVFLYGTRRAYDVAMELFNRYVETAKSHGRANISIPVSLLNALMTTQHHAGKHDMVEQCWDLAESQALRIAELSNTPLPSSITSLSPSPPTDSDVATPHEQPHQDPRPLTYNRRFILSRPLATYMRSLAATARYPAMQQLVDRLLRRGHGIDYRAWNTYVKLLLASEQHVHAAFRACEVHLMPQWAGWNPRSPALDPSPASPPAAAGPGSSETPVALQRAPYGSHRKPVKRFAYMVHDRARPDTFGPTYHTLVLLAKVVRDLREGRGAGVRTVRDGERMVAKVRTIAPRTWSALVTMPYAKDVVQEKYLRGNK